MADQDINIQIKEAVDKAGASNDLNSLKKSLKDLTNLSLQLGEEGGDAFKQVATAAGQVKDKINDARASINAVSGAPIENLAGSLNLAKSSLQGLDFGQAAAGIKLFATNLKGIKFSDIQDGIKGVTKSIVELGEAILTNPILLLAAIIILIIAKFDDLKAAGGAIGRIFTAIGDAVQFVIDALIKLSDSLGLTAIAAQKNFEKRLKLLDLEKDALNERYDEEIKLAQAAGENTIKLEGDKLKAIEDNAAATVKLYQDLKDAGVNLTQSQKDEFTKASLAYKQSLDDRLVFFRQLQQTIIKEDRDNDFDIQQRKIDLIKNTNDKLVAQGKLNAAKNAVTYKKQNDDEIAERQEFYKDAIALAKKHQNDLPLTNDNLTFKDTKKEDIQKNNKDLQDLQRQQSVATIDIEDKTNKKIELDKQESNKAIYENSLNMQASSLSEQQKIAQNNLELQLNDFKNSDAYKLQAQKDYTTEFIKLSDQQYDVQIKQATGNAQLQEQLRQEKIQAEKKANQEIATDQKEFNDNQIKQEQDRQDIKLQNNIQSANLLKEFAVTEEQQYNASLAVLQANNDKQVVDDKRVLDEKLKNVNLTETQRIVITNQYNEQEAQNKEVLEQRKLNLTKQYLLQTAQLLNQNQTDAKEQELKNLQDLGSFQLQSQLNLIQQISDLKMAALETQRVAEVTAAQNNADQISAINAKYAAKEAATTQDTEKKKKDAKLKSANDDISVAQSTAGALSALNDLITQSENQRLKTGEKASIELQKKQFERQKALGIVNAIINTATAVTTALALPPPYDVIQASIVGAAGAIQIATIAAQKFNPDTSGSGSSGSSSGPPSIPTAAVSQSVGTVQQPTVNGQTPTNIKVYVAENDITKVQQRVSTIQHRSTYP